MPAILKALLPTIIDKVFGRRDKMLVDKNGLNAKIVSATKGLIFSKTARFATGALVAKFVALWALPLPETALWALSVVFLVEYLAALYFRAITVEEV